MPDDEQTPSLGERLHTFGARIAEVLGISDASLLKLVPPSTPLHLRATAVSAKSVHLSWDTPKTGTQPMVYVVFFRPHGSGVWGMGATSKTTAAEIIDLDPDCEYDFEIIACNWPGSI